MLCSTGGTADWSPLLLSTWRSTLPPFCGGERVSSAALPGLGSPTKKPSIAGRLKSRLKGRLRGGSVRSSEALFSRPAIEGFLIRALLIGALYATEPLGPAPQPHSAIIRAAVTQPGPR